MMRVMLVLCFYTQKRLANRESPLFRKVCDCQINAAIQCSQLVLEPDWGNSVTMSCSEDSE